LVKQAVQMVAKLQPTVLATAELAGCG
jgi:hypothetical protein